IGALYDYNAGSDKSALSRCFERKKIIAAVRTAARITGPPPENECPATDAGPVQGISFAAGLCKPTLPHTKRAEQGQAGRISSLGGPSPNT
ncbi:MAG TPA: hypothetical protein VGF39_12275, partial [Stellaceae bacterium]